MPTTGSSNAAIPDKPLFQMSKHALERMAEARFRTELKTLYLEEMTLLLQERDLTPSQQKILKFFLIDTRNQTAANVQERAAKRSKNNPQKKRASAKSKAQSTSPSFWSGFTNWFLNISPGALIQRRTKNQQRVTLDQHAGDAPTIRPAKGRATACLSIIKFTFANLFSARMTCCPAGRRARRRSPTP